MAPARSGGRRKSHRPRAEIISFDDAERSQELFVVSNNDAIEIEDVHLQHAQWEPTRSPTASIRAVLRRENGANSQMPQPTVVTHADAGSRAIPRQRHRTERGGVLSIGINCSAPRPRRFRAARRPIARA